MSNRLNRTHHVILAAESVHSDTNISLYVITLVKIVWFTIAKKKSISYIIHKFPHTWSALHLTVLQKL